MGLLSNAAREHNQHVKALGEAGAYDRAAGHLKGHVRNVPGAHIGDVDQVVERVARLARQQREISDADFLRSQLGGCWSDDGYWITDYGLD